VSNSVDISECGGVLDVNGIAGMCPTFQSFKYFAIVELLPVEPKCCLIRSIVGLTPFANKASALAATCS